MAFNPRLVALLLGGLLTTAACSDKVHDGKTVAASPPPGSTPPKAAQPSLDGTAPAVASTAPEGQAINAAAFAPAAIAPGATRNALIRAQVLLDRARRSPGVIDGRTGTNLSLAIEAFQKARGLPVSGRLDKTVWDALVAGDSGPVMTDYAITADDIAGPFQPGVSDDDFEALAKLPALSYGSLAEALAERFHMDEALLRALNPGIDNAAAGTPVVVTAVHADTLPGKVTRIEIDKTRGQVRAFDGQSVLLAVYPATVGSTERPAPTGEWAVNTVAPRPTYTYDPSRLTFGAHKGKLTIKAGPNNPVGSTWIDLTKDTYGIHGTPDPKLVNKRASHGCVRLTNWDAAELGAAVQKGAKVVFLGAEAKTG